MLLTDRLCQAASNLVASLRQVLAHVVENLGTVVCGALAPVRGFACRLDGVANILAIAERNFAQRFAVSAAHLHGVAGIRPCLLASDVELYSAIDGRDGGVGFFF